MVNRTMAVLYCTTSGVSTGTTPLIALLSANLALFLHHTHTYAQAQNSQQSSTETMASSVEELQDASQARLLTNLANARLGAQVLRYVYYTIAKT
jgi:hypothetical protein